MTERGNEKSALVGDGYDHFVKMRVTGYVTYRFQNNMTEEEFEDWAEANVGYFDQMTNRSLDHIDCHIEEIETRPLKRKQASIGRPMTYDPTLSHSFSLHNGDNMEIIASYVLHNHSNLMDGDVVEETNYDHGLEMLDEPTDLQWLLKYMEYHYKKFGSHFEWEQAMRGR